jgi:hypothetical protein
MALFGDALVQEIVGLVERRYEDLGSALGRKVESDTQGKLDEQSKLVREVKLLISIANGEHMRSDTMVRRVELALKHVLDLLLGNAMGDAIQYPENFWQTNVGIVVSRARWWISIDDLITISNAAALAFGSNNQANRMRISRAIDNGLLEWVPDPSVANPQQNKRVLRDQVERMRDLSRLPGLETE